MGVEVLYEICIHPYKPVKHDISEFLRNLIFVALLKRTKI